MPSLHGLSTLYNSMRFADQYRRSQQPQQSFAFGQSPSGVPYADLAANVNQFMAGQAEAPYIANLPGYQGMIGQRSQNVMSQLQGDVPQDVINQIIQQAAQRGIFTGSPGGPGANAAYLRALGLTSIGQQQAGAAGLSQAIQDTPVPEVWNPMSLYVPERLAQQELAAARAGTGGGRVRFSGGGGVSQGSLFNPTTLNFSAQTAATQAAQLRERQKAYEDYWNRMKPQSTTGPTGTGAATSRFIPTYPAGPYNMFGGFPSFSMSGLY